MEVCAAMLVSRRFFLSRAKMIGFLDELEAAAGEARSLYIPFGLSQPEVDNLLEKVFDPRAIPPELAASAAGSKMGAVIFWSPSRTYLVSPPFPIEEKYFTEGYAVEPLRSLLKRDFMVALVLVRLGAYAVGICQGESLIISKVGTGLVHGRHKKGGSSQQRFQRHRQNQIDSFLDRVCGHVRERLEPQARMLDYLVYGGAWTTILSLQKCCSFLRQFEGRLLPPLLDIPEPRKVVLETAIGRAWSSSVIEWRCSETADC